MVWLYLLLRSTLWVREDELKPDRQKERGQGKGERREGERERGKKTGWGWGTGQECLSRPII